MEFKEIKETLEKAKVATSLLYRNYPMKGFSYDSLSKKELAYLRVQGAYVEEDRHDIFVFFSDEKGRQDFIDYLTKSKSKALNDLF